MPEQRRQNKAARPKPEKRRQPQHVADQPVGEAAAENATVQSPTTDRGLTIEEQVRKEWDPKKQGGLPIFLRTVRGTSAR